MRLQALGLIEVIGMTTALEAADTCAKSSNIEIIGCEKITNGLVTIKIQGNVGAVKAAIDAARISASQINTVVSTLIIPRPAEAILPMIKSRDMMGIHNRLSECRDAAAAPKQNVMVIEDCELQVEQLPGNSTSCWEQFDSLVTECCTECEEQEVQPEQELALLSKGQEQAHYHDLPSKQERSAITLKEDLDEPQLQEVSSNQLETDTSNLLSHNVGLGSIGVGKIRDKICNLCRDPQCPREKGQSNKLCLHYSKK